MARSLRSLPAVRTDQDGVYGEVAARYPEASVIVPPRSSTVPSDTAETAPTMRDRHMQNISERGRMAWQKTSGHHWRVLVEADISRVKRVVGDRLRTRPDQRRAVEVAIALNALNRMLELGRPEYSPPRASIEPKYIMGPPASCRPIHATQS